MSWIADRELNYRYKMEDGSIRHIKMRAADDTPDTYTFDDGEVGKYDGFEPDKLKQTHNVEYDQNGRKAIRTRGKNGEIQHISKTKLNYIKTGRIENQYTDSYRKHLEKTQQEQLLRAEHEKRKSRGRVSQASHDQLLKDKIGSLPDGEYLSDGNSFLPTPKQK